MKRFIREYLLENWSLKLLSVLIALILWMLVRGEPGPERVVRGVPLEVQVPPHMEITKEEPTSVEVTMRGAALSDLWLSQPVPTTCTIDLSGAKDGEHVITLTPENVKIPKGTAIAITQVYPAQVTIVLERTISREVPIIVPIRGQPQRGFEIYGQYTKPSSTIITGPRSRIEPIAEISTEPVSIEGQKQTARFFVGLNVKDKGVRTALENPVQVDIQIGPRRRLTTIARVPITVDDPAYAVSPQHLSVQVLAPVESIGQITPADFSATVVTKSADLSKLPAGIKPHVRILNSIYGMVIKDVLPAEVVIRKKQKK